MFGRSRAGSGGTKAGTAATGSPKAGHAATGSPGTGSVAPTSPHPASSSASTGGASGAIPGRLNFLTDQDSVSWAHDAIQRLTNKEKMGSIIPEAQGWEKEFLPVVIYSDFEPDDLMAIAQIWQFHLERLDLVGKRRRPVVMMVADFEKKDDGTVFEKKLLMARLLLGLEVDRDFQVITPSYGSTGHKLGQDVIKNRPTAMSKASQEIMTLNGKDVDFYIIAPGHGNLKNIVQMFPTSTLTSLKEKGRVVTYTGSFNTRGTHPDDFKALGNLVSSREPLTDISKFIFFGSKGSHPRTESADTFSSPTLAKEISARSRKLTAVIKLFAEEFTGALISPANHRLFSQGLSADEQRRFDSFSSLFHTTSIEAYCQKLQADPALFSKLAGFKQSTVRAFANGTVDMPLCDQVTFVYEWLHGQKDKGMVTSETNPQSKGTWWVDPNSGFSGVTPFNGPKHQHATNPVISAHQPSLANPKDEDLLTEVASAMEKYLLQHLDHVLGYTRDEAALANCQSTAVGSGVKGVSAPYATGGSGALAGSKKQRYPWG